MDLSIKIPNPKKWGWNCCQNATKKMGVTGIHNGARCQATIGHNLVWWCSETPCHCSFLPLSPTLPPHSFLLLLLLSSGSQLSLCLPLFTSQLHNRLWIRLCLNIKKQNSQKHHVGITTLATQISSQHFQQPQISSQHLQPKSDDNIRNPNLKITTLFFWLQTQEVSAHNNHFCCLQKKKPPNLKITTTFCCKTKI